MSQQLKKKIATEFLAKLFPKIDGPKDYMSEYNQYCRCCQPKPCCGTGLGWDTLEFNPGCKTCWEWMIDHPKIFFKVLSYGFSMVKMERDIRDIEVE